MDSVLAVIIARAGSRGLPNKCVAPLNGRAVIEYTFDHARSARTVDAVCLSTDSDEAKRLVRARAIFVIDRPPELAMDTATVDAAARHAVERYEAAHPGFRAGIVVLLYGNVPLRPPGAIDRAVTLLRQSGCDSVRTVVPVTKQHPDWLHRLDGDRLAKFRENSIYRRQDLEPLYYHDGAVVAVTRAALFAPPEHPSDFHAFFGRDRRAIVVGADETVDIDSPEDLRLAETLLRARTIQSVRIGEVEVGPGRRTYVIAEAGVNHDGRIDRALALIDAARAAGADAVKFQVFAADRLATRGAPGCDYQRRHDSRAASQHALLRGLELTRRDFELLRRRCKQAKIEFLATPFSVDDLRMLVDLGVRAIKLASPDVVHVPLLEAAAASGRAIIASTGAAEEPEIDDAVARLRGGGADDRLVLLHCVSSYPTPPAEANLRRIRALADRHALPVGFSDHTQEAATGGLAVAAGACVLEKHLTLDRTAPGPDHFFSLDPAAMREYIEQVRAAESMLGDGTVRLSPRQLETRRLARGCVVALRPIAAGDLLTAENITIKRAGEVEGSIPPCDFARLLGQTAIRYIAEDAVVKPQMIRPGNRDSPDFSRSTL